MAELKGVTKQILGQSVVVGILGRRRQGKTLLATYLCANAARAGVRVLHNGALKFGELIDLDELIKLGPTIDNSLLFLDEIHTLMDSQRGNSIVNYLLSHALVQLGHRRTWLLFTTQDQSMIPARLRWQTDVAVIVSSRNEGRTVRFKQVHQGSLGPIGYKRTGTLHRAYKMFPLYDTSKIISSMDAINATADTIRQRSGFKEAEQLRDLLPGLAEKGVDRISAAELSNYLFGTFGTQLSPERIGRMMGHLGYSSKKSNDRRYYDLTNLIGTG